MPGLTATPMLPLANYLYQGAAKVQGWLWPTTGTILAQVLVKQVQSGQQGDVCEVGVHHGKSFLVLANGIVAGERAVAVDVFGDQHKNVDQSGAGDRAVFEANLAAYAPGAAVEIIQRSSLELGPDWSPRPRFRLFSIDGGHTAQATANDLRLAERTALPGCVVALDDVFNTTWTGVITGPGRLHRGWRQAHPVRHRPEQAAAHHRRRACPRVAHAAAAGGSAGV